MNRLTEPAYIIPILIEQPTWGGQYIAEYKSIADQMQKNIGQSYELATESMVYFGDFRPCFQFAATSDLKTLVDMNVPTNAVPLASLLPESLGILIKFTQAQENSYQLHVKAPQINDQNAVTSQEDTHWLPKPESWYFFEDGTATLGVETDRIAAYKARCEEIDAQAKTLMYEIQSGTMTVADARQALQTYIDADHPRSYVKTITIAQDTAVDLSAGGIHHSWEANPTQPLGNIVYEVQQDVKDAVSTLRSFDQGKITDEGSIRPLTITEYFAALDSSPAANDPTNYLSQPLAHAAAQTTVFDTPYYKMEVIRIDAHQQQSLVSQGVEHLFVKTGAIEVTCIVEGVEVVEAVESAEYGDGEQNQNQTAPTQNVNHTHQRSWYVPAGWSLLIPEKTPYQIIAVQDETQPAIVLRTGKPTPAV